MCSELRACVFAAALSASSRKHVQVAVLAHDQPCLICFNNLAVTNYDEHRAHNYQFSTALSSKHRLADSALFCVCCVQPSVLS
jgi:hypothetical protein